MVLLGDEGLVELFLVCLETVLILTQDKCMVCIERTIGSSIVFTHPMKPGSDVSHVESRFSTFEDSVCVGAR
jgi:hypothetical protein